MTNSPDVARTGSRTPRVRSCPTYATSAGQEAIELGAAAGLELDPWQQDVMVDWLGERPDGKWAAPEAAVVVARQNGKNAKFEVRELAGLMLFGERFIVHTAHEVKTALEAFRRSQALFTNNDELRRLVKRVSNANGEEGIELFGTGPNRITATRRLRFIARSKHSGRGFTCDCLVWDEAYALTDDQVDAQMPALSAVPNKQILYGSSPPLNAREGAVLMRVRRRALAGDPRLAFHDWGVEGSLDKLHDPRCRAGHVPDCECVDLDDIDLAYASNPAMGIRISEETVRDERRAMSDVGYARERLGIWPADEGVGFAVISESNWIDALDVDSRIVGPKAFAAAVSIDRKRSAIAVCGQRADGQLHVEITSESTPHGVELDNRNDTGWIPPRLKTLVERHDTVAVVMDEYGPTGSLIPEVERELATAAGRSKPTEVTRIKTGDVGRAFGMLYDGICGRDPATVRVRHIGQRELTDAVAGATTRAIGDAKAWDRRDPNVDIATLVAATNAVWGFMTRESESKVPFNTGVFVP